MPFKKGQSGNPNGAPVKEMRISTWLEKELGEIVPETLSLEAYEAEVSIRQHLAKLMVLRAISPGDKALEYIREILDRTEGKSTQKAEVTGDGGGALTIKLVNYAEDAGANDSSQP